MLTKRPLAIPRSQMPSLPQTATFLTRISRVIDKAPCWAPRQCTQTLRHRNCRSGATAAQTDGMRALVALTSLGGDARCGRRDAQHAGYLARFRYRAQSGLGCERSL